MPEKTKVQISVYLKLTKVKISIYQSFLLEFERISFIKLFMGDYIDAIIIIVVIILNAVIRLG